ncbi:tRNA (cytidine(34)-2'-O)-methyltransferase [Arthrobacter sp. Br18]|uniref:tRNA (cytidine(34)-2'-O)-methyltransferase n=1 Tax=Arthrobacter sp. Br18 TaxID=1312954 RepID=UPI00047D4569|nr:tRNA (cytidine(34)-2'-O)-methyltransferase [Arthrobacter sp. Br18]
MLRIVFHSPEIPGNTGNTIRLAAVAGARLHLVEPLGFSLDDSKLRRAGLDYHDLTVLTVHPSLAAAWESLEPERVFAFTSDGEVTYTDIQYRASDILLFGPESMGLDEDVKNDPHVSARVRVPMLESRRSLNLANTASIALYEAWRQHGFNGAVLSKHQGEQR